MPKCDAVFKDALDGAAIEVHQDQRRHVDVLQSPLEEERIVCLLGVEVLSIQERSSEMWTPRNLKLETRSTSVPWMGVCVQPFGYPQ